MVFHKTKIEKHLESLSDIISRTYGWGAFVTMSLAAVLSVIELHAARGPRQEMMLQPAYASASSSSVMLNRGEELLRREKEETAHSVVSYGETMRSHPISGAQ